MPLVKAEPFDIDSNVIPMGAGSGTTNVLYWRTARPPGVRRVAINSPAGGLYKVGDDGQWLVCPRWQDLNIHLPPACTSVYSTAGVQVEWLPDGAEFTNRPIAAVLIGAWDLLPLMPINSGNYVHCYLSALSPEAMFASSTQVTGSNAYNRAWSIDVSEYSSLTASVHSEATIAGQVMGIAGGLHFRSTSGASNSSYLVTGTPTAGTQSGGNGSPIDLRTSWNLDANPARWLDLMLQTSGGTAFASANMGGECRVELWGVPRAA